MYPGDQLVMLPEYPDDGSVNGRRLGALPLLELWCGGLQPHCANGAEALEGVREGVQRELSCGGPCMLTKINKE